MLREDPQGAAASAGGLALPRRVPASGHLRGLTGDGTAADQRALLPFADGDHVARDALGFVGRSAQPVGAGDQPLRVALVVGDLGGEALA